MTNKGSAINSAKDSAFRLAYTLGIISPKININAATKPTSTSKVSQGYGMPENSAWFMLAKSMTIEMFMRLLRIKIVASNRCGFWRSLAINLFVL